MIKSLIQYLLEETFPRTMEILKGSELWLAIIVGVVCSWWAEPLVSRATKVSDVGLALLTYAAIAFGFCLAGLTLVLTLPNQDLISRLATTQPPKAKHNSYSSLLFVFTWTSFAHWILIVFSVVIFVLAGSDQTVLPFSSKWQRVLAGSVAGLSAYCLFQFLITLFTLSQVGRLNINVLQRAAAKAQSHTLQGAAASTPPAPKTSASS